MARVAVHPALLRWARERAGLTPDDLRQKFPKLDEWEAEATQPTLRQLESFARTTMTPFGYFFLPEPPVDQLPIPDFRTVQDQAVRIPSPNLLETVQTQQRRQAWLRETLVAEGEQPLPFVGTVTTADDTMQVAHEIRQRLGIEGGWAEGQGTWTDALRALRLMVDSVGIVVATNGVVGNNTHRKLNPVEFRGFVLVDEFAPFVFINGADGKAAQMFTLAHELAHVWLGQSGVFDLRELQPANNAIELFCNAVAAEFLLPAHNLERAWEEARRNADPYQILARRFKVSAIVAARRVLDLGFITRPQFFEFYEAYEQDERRRRETRESGGDFYLTQNVRLGRRFAVAVVHAVKDGRMLYREAYELTGLSGATFDKYVKEIETTL